ncbi:MAG: DUF805 domain-containing protein [Candidatus Adiutrix sp.]|jgi:serine/threonine protein kinase|nr:DUF805 domain-containing protein [Candidatus Adiutrix sp.]
MNSSQALPAGLRLHGYFLEKALNSSDADISYLATHEILKTRHVIREFMPPTAIREGETAVRPKDERCRELFAGGLKSFCDEAWMLNRLSHPSVVKVSDVFKANGTAYFVRPRLEGLTLHDWLKSRPRPDKATLISLFVPLLEGLKYIHREKLPHLDIRPENIHLLPNGHPVLIEFGAARKKFLADLIQSGGDMAFRPSPYEPFESCSAYGQAAETLDIYSLGACLYLAVTGGLPVVAADRARRDPQPQLATSDFARTYGRAFLAAIDKALAVRPEDRFQNALEFQQALMAEDSRHEPPAHNERREEPRPQPQPQPQQPPQPPQPPRPENTPSTASVSSGRPGGLRRLFFTIQGRVNREPYWLCGLSLGLISVPLAALAVALKSRELFALVQVLPIFLGLLMIPVAVKRCHDRGKSGWFLLLGLIPLVNFWVTVELLFLRGTVGPNKYGDDPLA